MFLSFPKETLSYRIKNGDIKEEKKIVIHFDLMHAVDEYSLESFVKGCYCEYQSIIFISSYHLGELHNNLVRE